MPLVTPKGSVTTQYGNVTQVLIGEQADYETPSHHITRS